MPGTCEVCVSEPSKYKCPTCGLMSCSLACTQSHKIYCAPNVQAPDTTTAANIDQSPSNTTNEPDANENAQSKRDVFDVEALASSPQIKDLLAQNPKLRDQLQDIYKTTLEEEWVEHGHAGRSRPYRRGRGGRGGHQNRGSWTWEKGYNRGLGKVRKMRERCEEGLETGKHAEDFMKFRTLINGDDQNQTSV
ncbi:zinc finger HIT domain-containing protein [Aspergillus clavatus NRRL 1]|uniref:HIT finger domain protein, putative n=1 Tax=Aspergillus clavatus (strain ATCC 1007 / CBS 513.65 / DSM 816 / NCTC 3887 / NRRL 1 / QM 1276 / 107) TaxID=344612 RepID=A1CRJ5_ASPCL|nr:HIT finger domain protein, putative [Aspergillus clavatus NRRL 1]EAW08266.1 HIT finger domain protein, putative [Aspergillus clavatus NRRL 1]